MLRMMLRTIGVLAALASVAALLALAAETSAFAGDGNFRTIADAT